MREFLVDNKFVVFVGRFFKQIVGIPMGTDCAPLLADNFSVLIRSGLHTVFALNWKEKVSISVHLHTQIHRWRIVNQLPRFWELSDVSRWTWDKNTTESITSASYLDLLLSIGRDGQLRTSLYDKRDEFNFHNTNWPFLSSNIPYSPDYGVFISQLIRYARACSFYEGLILRAARFSSKLLGQGYVRKCLK